MNELHIDEEPWPVDPTVEALLRLRLQLEQVRRKYAVSLTTYDTGVSDGLKLAVNNLEIMMRGLLKE